MNLFHSIGNAWDGLTGSSSKDGKESVNYNFLACAGFLVVLGFAGLLCWTLKGVLTAETFALLGGIVKHFLWVYGAIMLAKIAGNTAIIINRQQLAFKDGQLSDAEERALESADRGASGSPSAGAALPKP